MTSARLLGLTVQGISGGEELVVCPFHHDHKASAWFNPRKDLFYCAVCGLGLNLVQLGARLGIAIEQDGELETEPDDYDLLDPHEAFGVDRFEIAYIPYFATRGLIESTCRYYNLRFKRDEPIAAVIPIPNLKGTNVAVALRYIEPERTGTRYKFLGQPTPVWPMDKLPSLREGDSMVVCEGVWSTMKMHTYCFSQTGAHGSLFSLMGAKANQRIVDLLQPYNPIFLYDNDRAGRNACRKMRQLAPTWKSYVLPVSPDDMSYAEIDELLQKIQKVAFVI